MSRDQLDSTRSNKTFVQRQAISHILNSCKNFSFWFRDVRLTTVVVEVETKQITNLLHHRSPNQSSFCTKTILLFFAVMSSLCAPLFSVPTQRRPSNDLCYVKRRCSHVQKSTKKIWSDCFIINSSNAQHMFTESAFIHAIR